MCKLTEEINSKISKLEQVNNQIASFDDDLIRLPGSLGANDVKEDLGEKSQDHKKELINAVNQFRSNTRKTEALKAILQCLNGAIDVAVAALDYTRQQKKEGLCN